MTAALDQIAQLAKILGAESRQLRTDGRRVLAIAGKQATLRPSHSGDSILLIFRVHNHDETRRLLARRGLMTRLATGLYELGRMPADDIETDALGDLLGIDRRRAPS